MSKIMVSISCITYNHEEYIADALDSFLMQETDFKYEILIHDDASTDGTAAIIEKYEAKYPNIIKPILQTENQYSQGVQIDYVFNYPRARGKYIAVCEGDDYWIDPKKLQKQVDYMEAHPECTLCAHTVVEKDSKGKLVGEVRPTKQNRILSTEEVIDGGGYFVGTASLLYPKQAAADVPEYYKEASTGDYPAQIYLSAIGYLYFIDEPMAVYRVNLPGSWTNRHNSDYKLQIEHNYKVSEMLRVLDDYFDGEYSEAFRDRISEVDFARLLKEGRIAEAKKEKYYQNLKSSIKIKTLISYYLSGSYQIYSKIRNKLR